MPPLRLAWTIAVARARAAKAMEMIYIVYFMETVCVFFMECMLKHTERNERGRKEGDWCLECMQDG